MENKQAFDELSALYWTWIIKYCPADCDSPLFFVWYTDTDVNNTDKFLTFKTGEIFAVQSLKTLKEVITRERSNLVIFENMDGWLNNFADLEPVEFSILDIGSIINAIDQENVDIMGLMDFVNFVNMYGDYMYQDPGNSHLQVYHDNELINKTWNYAYDHIFWPSYTGDKNREPYDIPHLDIDTSQLVQKFNEMVRSFEDCIKIAS